MLPHINGTKLPNPLWRELSIDRVLQYYDGPRLLLRRSQAGQIFLAWWSDSDESTDRWIYLPLSESRLHAILSGEIPSRAGLADPEDGCVFIVDVDLDTDLIVQTISTGVSAIPDDALPRPGARLNIPIPEELSSIPSNERAQRAHITDLIGLKTQTDLTIKGKFVAGSLRSLRFEIEASDTASDTENRYNGLIHEDAISDVKHITLGSSCQVVLQPKFEVDETTGEEKITYTLLSIKAA